MNNDNMKKEIIFWIILLIPFAYAAYIWNDLPEQIPTHWNVKGEIDDYSSKPFGALFLPVLNVGLYLLLLLLPKIDPRKKNYELFTGPYRVIRLSVILLNTVIYFIVIRTAMGDEINIEKIIPVAVCLLFVILGNYMGNIRPNWFLGIRTPWTLENEEVWRKTHQLGGKLFFFGGLLGILLVLLSGSRYEYVFLPLLLIIAFTPVVCSYFIYRKIVPEKKQ